MFDTVKCIKHANDEEILPLLGPLISGVLLILSIMLNWLDW